MVQDAYGPDELANDVNLAGKVRWIGDDLLGLGGEAHTFALLSSFLHRCLESGDRRSIVQDLVNCGIEHIGTPIDCR